MSSNYFHLDSKRRLGGARTTRITPRILILVLAGACAQDRRADEPAGTRLAISETPTELTIVGLAPDGAEVERVHLQIGRFYVEDYEDVVDARQLEISIDGDTVTHQSKLEQSVELPFFGEPQSHKFNQLLQRSEVREALARWQIRFDDASLPLPGAEAPSAPSPGAKEAAYDSCTYASCAGQQTLSCYQRNLVIKVATRCEVVAEQHLCCGNTTKNAARRRCGYTAAGAPGANPCGTEGTNGCRVCWQAPWSTSCSATHGSITGSSCTEEGETWTLNSHLTNVTYN